MWHYRKKTFWIVITAALLSAAAVLFLLTNHFSKAIAVEENSDFEESNLGDSGSENNHFESRQNVVLAAESIKSGEYKDCVLRLIMTEGEYYTEEQAVPESGIYGENYEGKYILQLRDTEDTVLDEISLNEDWEMEKINFPGAFALCVGDYNKDELPEVTIGNYSSSRMNLFRIYSVDRAGKIINIGRFMDCSRDFSIYPEQLPEGADFCATVWNNAAEEEEKREYVWSMEEERYIEELHPDISDTLFARMPQAFTFLSGAGAWRTHLYLNADGSFTGKFSDWDAGSYQAPHGTYEICKFSGRFTQPCKIDDYTYSVFVQSLEYEKPGREYDADGFHYIICGSYGLEEAEEVLIYLPGQPLEEIPEEVRHWLYSSGEALWRADTEPERLPFYALNNVNEQTGFSSDVIPQRTKKLPNEAPDLSDALFAQISQEFTCTNGTEGGDTKLQLKEDGSFTGSYLEKVGYEAGIYYYADYDEIVKKAPKGVYRTCEFTGEFTRPRKINDYAYSVYVLNCNWPEKDVVTYKDGYAYITSYAADVFGNMLVYLPGYPAAELPEAVYDRLYSNAEGFRGVDENGCLTSCILYNANEAGQIPFFSESP